MASDVQHTGRASLAVEVWWSDRGWADVAFTFWVCVCCVSFPPCVCAFLFLCCVCVVCVLCVLCVCVCVCARVVFFFFFVVSTLSLPPWSPGISYFLALLFCLFLHHILVLLQACTFDEDGAVAPFRFPSALVPAWSRTVLDVSRENMTTAAFIPSTGFASCWSGILHFEKGGRGQRKKSEKTRWNVYATEHRTFLANCLPAPTPLPASAPRHIHPSQLGRKGDAWEDLQSPEHPPPTLQRHAATTVEVTPKVGHGEPRGDPPVTRHATTTAPGGSGDVPLWRRPMLTGTKPRWSTDNRDVVAR